MKKLFFPAVFHVAEEGGYWVTFPDLPECITEGDDMDQAYSMAVEAMDLAVSDRLKKREELTEPSDFRSVEDGGKLVIIPFDMDEYNRRHNSGAVKKTLTIPAWLNEKALARNINFSQVLQEALIEKMGL